MTVSSKSPKKGRAIGFAHPTRDACVFDHPLIDLMFTQLHARRINLHLSQKQVAERMHCSARTVVNLEMRQHMPSLDMFLRYAAALDFTLIMTEMTR